MTESFCSIAAFVPMKGHSERVPGKNLRPLAGRPLYHWIIDSLLQVERITTVAIDTDSEAIAEDVQRNFSEVSITWRPEDLRGDCVPMHDVLANAVTQVEERLIIQTHSTNPLLRPGTIRRAIEAFDSTDDHDSLFTVTPLQTRLFWEDGRPINHDPGELLRTQDLPVVYEENSCLYLFPREVIERTGRRIGSNPMLCPIAAEEAIDIDVEFDFRLAERMIEILSIERPAHA